MRNELINIYTYAELTQAAKDTAFYDYLSDGYEHAYTEENIASVRAFCEYFGVSIQDYSLGTCSYSYIKTDVCNEHMRGIKPKAPIDSIDSWGIGCSMDYGLLEGWEAFIQDNPSDTLGAFKSAIDQAVIDIVKDMEWQESQEYFEELAECNDWEYVANGTRH